MIKNYMLLGALSILLTSCASAQSVVVPLPTTLAAQCTAGPGGECPVSISVNGSNCKPQPEYYKVAPGVTIVWTLSPSDWEFEQNGITFKDPSKADKAFENSNKASAREWRSRVRGAPQAGQYEYDVRVRNTRTGATCVVDPGIWI